MGEGGESKLRGVAETLLIPLAFRALESQEPEPLVMDPTAGAIVAALGVDIERFRKLNRDRVFTMLRAREFDRCARAFLAEAAQPVVVEIGCGLDNRLARVDDRRVLWYQLDLPEVMQLRAQVQACRNRGLSLSGSALDAGWMTEIPRDPRQTFLFLAEGVLPYFREDQVRWLVLALRDRFPGCRLVMDVLSPFLAWMEKRGGLGQAASRIGWTLRDDAGLQEWGDGIRLLGTWTYFDEREPRLESLAWMRYLPPLARGARVVRYQLGVPEVVSEV